MWTIAAVAFVAIFFLKVPFPAIIISAGAIGLVGERFWKAKFLVFSGHGGKGKEEESVISDNDASPEHTRPSWGEWRLDKRMPPFGGLATPFISAHSIFVQASVS